MRFVLSCSWRIGCTCLSVLSQQLYLNTGHSYSLFFFHILSHIIVTPTEFKTQGMYDTLRIELSGGDFFGECAANIEKVVFWKDREKIRTALNKEFLMKALETGDSFASIYRLIIDGTPTYYRFKAARAEPSGRHIVIGVSNISSQMALEREFEAAQQHSLTYSRIAQALSQDYILVYYVNTKTEKYVEYVVNSPDYTFKVRKVGERFFEECRHDIIRMVPAEDRDQALMAFDKENLLNELSMVNTFSISYRVNLNGEEVYANFKIMHFEDDSHIVIGVRDIGEQVRFEREYENARLENVTYSSIAKALAADYFAIYYVDTLTDRFIEYSSFEEYSELNIEKGGEDFFNATRNNIIRVVYHEDTEVVSSALVKENLLRELDNTGTFTLNYRLMFGGRPTYVSLKATRMKDRDDGRYIVIGVSNVDNQIRREEELSLAREKANRDALTGVKSKHAWLETEAEINARITASVQKPFSLAVCDLNGLKYINDNLGHKEGDRYILSASEIICNTFAHSPVFRIGGDEFVVLLTDRDYEHRDALMAELASINENNAHNGGVVIASGISDYMPGEDLSSASVFERADTLMYRNKAVLKDRKV